MDALRRLIEAEGPIPFERFMAEALYGADGFYTTGGTAGRRGDFITSPEVGPLFGTVLARWVTDQWDRLGRPTDFAVIDAGAGPGTLARSLRPALEFPHRYIAVEVSTSQRTNHPPDVESVGELPRQVAAGVVIANELLDNLPFRLLVFDNGWREAFVALEPSGQPVEVLSAPLADPPPWLPRSAAHGSRVPWQQQAAAWIGQATTSIEHGSVLCFDYCTATTAMIAGLPWREWLRTYRSHQRGDHYLAGAGTQDITSQVCIDQLPEPMAVRTQAQFLQRWGVDELVAQGREVWAASAARPTVEALRMRSRVREAEALLDPTGLGGFVALEWLAGSR